MSGPRRILHLNTSDSGGGAEGSAWELCCYMRQQGLEAKLLVGRKYRVSDAVIELPRPPSYFIPGRPLQYLGGFCRRHEQASALCRPLSRILERLAHPRRLWQWWRGLEEFDYPGSAGILEMTQNPPDLLHCHNLHGYYFDLRVLPELSRRVPVVLSLHDAWLLSGHCSHFFDCQRWQNGCGKCPNLKIYPPCRRDNTAQNWRTKADIYARSRLYVTAPSQWLLKQAQNSMLKAKEYRMIPNGIDCQVFKPGSRAEARKELNLPLQPAMVLFCAASPKSAFKDPQTMSKTVLELARQNPGLRFVCIGLSRVPEELRGLPLLALPYQSDPKVLAQYYRAADVFVHTAKAETFGKTVTESMACASAVVASAVGGLTEQILPGKTGLLAKPGDPEDTANAVMQLLNMPAEAKADMDAAAARQGAKYSLQNQGDAFMQWYEEILVETRQSKILPSES
ncbi:MAG: glycosyltransferase [Lentisphaeria bacterium]|nr:glycosyltransferase [Lentisphaeria bacterium]